MRTQRNTRGSRWAKQRWEGCTCEPRLAKETKPVAPMILAPGTLEREVVVLHSGICRKLIQIETTNFSVKDTAL